MPDRERVGRFLRTLVGLLTVAWLAVAVVSPPDPFTFALALVPAWVLAGLVAVAMELGDGYRRLRRSPLYRPGTAASTATAVFVAVTLLAKAVLTAAADWALGARNVGDPEGAALGVLAVFVAYVLVFVLGAVGWVHGGAADT